MLCILSVEKGKCVYIEVQYIPVNVRFVLYYVLESTLYTSHSRTLSLRSIGIETSATLEMMENQVAYSL